jgi:threonine/homoserine/homoserine lactone efflux protein
MEPLLKGIIAGITISLMIGPIFLALADITISKGWRSGMAYIAGILITDFIFIYLVETIFNHLSFEDLKTPIALIGGAVLILFGVITFISKVNLKSPDVTSVKTLIGAFLKGFTLNLFNPFVAIWWITMYTTIAINYPSRVDKGLFYGGILAMVFLFDLVKMRFSYYLKQHLTTEKLQWLKKIVGVCLIGFGAFMLVSSF